MNNFINKHFGSIITAIVTLIVSGAAIYVSCEQVKISRNDSDREWNIEAAKFIAENHRSIFGKDNKTRERFFEIIELSYPPELAGKLRLQMFDQYTIDNKDKLFTFLKPNGTEIHNKNKSEFVDWLQVNKPNLIPILETMAEPDFIKTFLINTNNAIIRKDAVKGLDLNNRVLEFGYIPEDVLKMKIEELKSKGADVFYNIQNDGYYRMTVIYPKQ